MVFDADFLLLRMAQAIFVAYQNIAVLAIALLFKQIRFAYAS